MSGNGASPQRGPWVAMVWVGILGAIEVSASTNTPAGLFVPVPSRVATALWGLIADGSIATHLVLTLTRIVGGLALGAGIGVLLGLLMGTSPRLRRVIDPMVAALHPIPRLAFFPLLIVVLGVGERSKLAAVALSAFFPMLLNTVAGVRGIHPAHIDIARNCGATRQQMFLDVLLPGSLPLMLTGLRLSANSAFHSTIGVEMVGSRTGIGSLLWLSWQTFRIDRLYAVLVVVAAVGIALETLLAFVTRRSAPWLVEPAAGKGSALRAAA